MSGASNKFQATYTAAHKKAPRCPPVMLFSWLTIILWVGFLVYSLHYGLITSNQVSVLIEDVKLLEQTALRGHGPFSGGASPPVAAAVPVPVMDHSQDVYVIFSTDCKPYQDWQSLVLFHSAKLVGQKGVITRIASGCDEEKKAVLTKLYHDLHGDYCTVHFTPDFKIDEKTQKSFDYYNKPYGLKHWLENGNVPNGVVIALIDPDMVFLRPITPSIRAMPYIVSKRTASSEVVANVTAGHPVAQTYGLGAPWAREKHKHFDKYKICGKDSPCVKPVESFAEMHYSVGPPYVAVKEDFIRIAKSWTYLVPRVFEDYPWLLAEMYAYSMASAHEELPHLQLEHYMVSNVDSDPGEGWPWVDELPQVCVPSVDSTFYPGQRVPTVAHFCQTYRVGDLAFTKRRVPNDIFTCEHPLFIDVPADVTKSDYFVKKNEKKTLTVKKAKRNAFMVCVLYEAVNSAMVDYKQKMCSGRNSTNYAKTFSIHG